MKITGLLTSLLVFLFTACMDYVPADEVIPAVSKVATIDIVLPGAPGFTFTDRENIDSLMSFLRENCHWTRSPGYRVESKEAKERGYRIVVHRSDGPPTNVEVEDGTLLAGAYLAILSAHAAKKLDDLCDLETIHLSPFHAEKPIPSPEPANLPSTSAAEQPLAPSSGRSFYCVTLAKEDVRLRVITS